MMKTTYCVQAIYILILKQETKNVLIAQLWTYKMSLSRCLSSWVEVFLSIDADLRWKAFNIDSFLAYIRDLKIGKGFIVFITTKYMHSYIENYIDK